VKGLHLKQALPSGWTAPWLQAAWQGLAAQLLQVLQVLVLLRGLKQPAAAALAAAALLSQHRQRLPWVWLSVLQAAAGAAAAAAALLVQPRVLALLLPLQVVELMQALLELRPCLSPAVAAALQLQHWEQQVQLWQQVWQQGQRPAAETAGAAAAAAQHRPDWQLPAVLLAVLVLLPHCRL
jgi:hypothetical protein